jgi:hypothetical protein
MKTNQIMQVSMLDSTLEVEHKTRMVSLNDVFLIGNRVRADRKAPAGQMTPWLKTKGTQDLIDAGVELGLFTRESAVQVKGKAARARTCVHLTLAIAAAEYLDPKFHMHVLNEFVNGQILRYRDESGDQFKALNKAIDALPDRIGKDNKNLYIQTAVMLKKSILGEDGNWNSASADQLRERTKIETSLVDTLDLGLIQDWPTLKSVIEKKLGLPLLY